MSLNADCLFCKIISGQISSTPVFENDNVLVIRDIQPQAPTHLLILPRKHVASLNDLDDKLRQDLLPKLFTAADTVAEQEGFRNRGYRTVFNNQAMTGQTVFHLHLHVLSGTTLNGFGA